MGDRAIVVFQRGDLFSPGIYLHSNGSDAPDWIRAAVPHLRRGDAEYSAARFCGCCHAWIDGNTGLGLLPPPDKDDVRTGFDMYTDDALFIVCMETGQVSALNSDFKSFTIDNFEKVCPT